MKLRPKFFLILGISQILLVLSLLASFIVLIKAVKDEPQNYRAHELAKTFENDLQQREIFLKKVVEQIVSNSKNIEFFKKGLESRNHFHKNINFYEDLKSSYNLNVLEIGSPVGKVLFRFHRPEDFGDDKSKQKIIQDAINGKISSTIEVGHSGLALRVTAPILNNTILLGQVVNREFLKGILTSDKIHIALLHKENLIASSNEDLNNYIISNFVKISNTNSFRMELNSKEYYLLKIKYDNKQYSSLDLDFVILIDETELNQKTAKIWKIFGFLTLLLFCVIFFISYLFSRNIINSIKKLSFAMTNLDNKLVNHNFLLDTKRKDEIGEMGKVFINMKDEIYKYQNHLESLVDDKTLKLQTSLNEIKKLKDHQDGDYFLTSLLLIPFYTQKIETSTLTIDSILRQKKKFYFKNKESQIGGDLIMIEKVLIKDKTYIALINADAMGKSIQGAGGAIVLGTVFKSFINRLKNSFYESDDFPEILLKNCFTELHEAFLTFDGSMIISAIICLIDEQSGGLFFINSEHPYPILLRNSKASFIGYDLFNRKIGLDLGDDIIIQSFQMEDGDIIIIGTDGRDDILILKENTSHMNEDEYLFSRIVEKTSGDLNSIEKELLNIGELTDDLSLVKIEYNNIYQTDIYTQDYLVKLKNISNLYKNQNFEEAEMEAYTLLMVYPNNFKVMRIYCKLLLRNKKFNTALNYISFYLKSRPADSIFLYYCSFVHRQLGNIETAIYYSKKYLSRYPNDNKVLNFYKSMIEVTENEEAILN
jgi:serine phosphatase RsbU (regulator of sigma subunit)